MALMDFCAERAKTALLVLREPDWLDDSAKQFIEQAEPFLLLKEQVSEWPGTRLTSGHATAFRYSIVAESIQLLKDSAQRLYEWQQPTRLEDLCFLRDGGTPLLVTIAHENDAYLELQAEEYEALLQQVPGLEVAEHS